ncbi:MAG: hypothetical protein ACFFKA_08770 [Candidatus Thorarchaeota archaeon]
MDEKSTKTITLNDYKILREEKRIIFEDTNVIEDNSNYLIEFKREIKPNQQYLLITPFNYFRIPEDIRTDISPELMELEPMDLYERIIWYYIFEIIYKNSVPDLDWTDLTKDISKRLSVDSNRIQKRLSKERIISESIKERVKNINLKELIEKERNIKDILEYPNFKGKTSIFSNWSTIKFILFLLFISSFLLNFFSLSNDFMNLFLMWFFISGGIVFLHFFLYNVILRKVLLRKDFLRKKIEEVIPTLIPDFKSQLNKGLIRKYLRAYTEDLFQRIFFNEYNNLFEIIKDYKTFNPISLLVKFDDEEYPTEPHSITQFFRNTTISLDFSQIPTKGKYELSIQTKRTIRIIRKTNRFTRKNITFNKSGWGLLIFLLALPWFTSTFFTLQFVKLIFFYVSLIFATYLVLFGVKFTFKYYSSLQEIRKQATQKLTLFNYFKIKFRKIYSIPTNLRRDCSYDWVIDAPQFHNVKMSEEIKKIFKNLERPLVLRLPHKLSKNVLSFHIPKSKNIKEVDFQLDLELPFMARIVGWLIGMNIMLINMLSLSIIYLVFTFTPEISLDFTNIRVILPFLTLLIGFFGKNILESPTKDLHKWAGILISLTVIIGLLLFVSSIIDLLVY